MWLSQDAIDRALRDHANGCPVYVSTYAHARQIELASQGKLRPVLAGKQFRMVGVSPPSPRRRWWHHILYGLAFLAIAAAWLVLMSASAALSEVAK
jgi:hypothetical protein